MLRCATLTVCLVVFALPAHADDGPRRVCCRNGRTYYVTPGPQFQMGVSSGPISIPAQLHVAEEGVQAQSQPFVPPRLIPAGAISQQLDDFHDRLFDVMEGLERDRAELKMVSAELHTMAEECAELHGKVDGLAHVIGRAEEAARAKSEALGAARCRAAGAQSAVDKLKQNLATKDEFISLLTQKAIDADETERKTIDSLITGVKEQRLLVEKAMPAAMDELNSAKVELTEATAVVESVGEELQMLRTQQTEASGQVRRCETERNERRTKQTELQLLLHQHEESRLRLEGGIEALERYAPVERRAVPMQIEPLEPPTSSLNQ